MWGYIHFTYCAEIYSTLNSKVQNKTFSSIYFKNLFDDNNIDWVEIYVPSYIYYIKSETMSWFSIKDFLNF